MESVCYYWNEGEWNVPRILRIIPMPLAQTICQIPIAAGQGIELCGRSLVRGIFQRNLHGKLFDKLHLGDSYLLMSGTVPCGQLFQFSCGVFFKIESQWTRECNKRGSVFHLNVSAVTQRRQFPICSLRAQQCRACGSTLLPFLGSASVIRGASPIWCTSGDILPHSTRIFTFGR
ncbi:UNVERIFIED_CONTAM: hypothetical protein Sradi_7124200 [Sesamum radiatum]|uniref:Uncharacterized protein n=1 Tax=Sesamum radiatum TaxID=300843 RepID=A0AAW2IZ94_SESRA